MKPSQNAIDLVKASEGVRLAAYPDPATGGAPWTIGYGSTRGVTKGLRITMDEAEGRLDRDLLDAAASVSRNVAVPLNQNQFDALVDFVFNLGEGNFRKSTLLRLINERNYQAAAKQFNSWVMAAGKVMPGLVTRRAAERALFERAA